MNFSFSILFLLLVTAKAQAIDVYGNLGIEYDHFFQDIQDRNGSRAKYKASLETKAQLNNHWTMKFNPILWLDPQSKAKGQRVFYDTHEGYLEYYKGFFSAKIGYQQINWGVTESFDPTKVIHSYVLWDPLTWQPLATPAVNLQFNWRQSAFTILYVPLRRKTLMPQAESRWLPSEIINNEVELDDNLLILPDRPIFSYREGQEVDHALSNNFGFRYSETYGPFDSALFYYQGAAPVPFTRLYTSVAALDVRNGKNVYILDPQIGLEPIDYRQSTVGGTFVYSNDHFIARYAANYVDTISEVGTTIPAWSQANVVALEMNWLNGDLISVMEYSHIRRAGLLGNTVTDITRLFDRAFTLALRYEVNENWQILGSWLYDSKNFDQIGQVEISGKLTESIKLNMSWIDLIAANTLSPLGAYNKNDRAQISFWYYF